MSAELTRDQVRTLLYLECRLTDHGGRVNAIHLNEAERKWLRKMNESGFLAFGRVKADDCGPEGSHWVVFSDEAWNMAHAARRDRFRLRVRSGSLCVPTDDRRSKFLMSHP